MGIIFYKINKMNPQRRLDLIQFWLSKTTEEFDEWDYNGEELIIFLSEEAIERYDNKTIDELLGMIS
jgi:hypothetical protein